MLGLAYMTTTASFQVSILSVACTWDPSATQWSNSLGSWKENRNYKQRGRHCVGICTSSACRSVENFGESVLIVCLTNVGSLVSAGVYSRLAGSWASAISTSHLTTGVLGFRMCGANPLYFSFFFFFFQTWVAACMVSALSTLVVSLVPKTMFF